MKFAKTINPNQPMPDSYTMTDLIALMPAWEKTFGEDMPFGFEVRPAQVPIIKECIAKRSQEPLNAFIRGLGTDVTF
ncbi:MAG: hypothetical protein OXD40_02695 [bacterium]|nr:hypothetical protein [bacterium]